MVGGGVFKGLFLVFYDGNLKNKNVIGGFGFCILFLRFEYKSMDLVFYIYVYCIIIKLKIEFFKSLDVLRWMFI